MEKLTILGAGTMGHSIALSAAWSGQTPTVYGINEIQCDGLLCQIGRTRERLRLTTLAAAPLPVGACQLVDHRSEQVGLDLLQRAHRVLAHHLRPHRHRCAGVPQHADARRHAGVGSK